MVHLEGVTADDLREALRDVHGAVAAQRVMLALNYKEEEVTQTELASRYGISEGTVHNWLSRLDRLACEPLEDVVYDDSPSGRPRSLSGEERRRLAKALRRSPNAAGYGEPAWTTELVQTHVSTEFDVDYSRRHVRRLMRELEGSSDHGRGRREP